MGTKRITAADIARSLGVSRATVGYVLNDTPGQKISEATRGRVLAEAARLGYRPNLTARALAGGRSPFVLLVVPDWPLTSFSMGSGLNAASQVIDQAGYCPITYTFHPGERTRRAWESLDPAVVICIGLFQPDEIATMREWGIGPIVPDPQHQQLAPDTPAIEDTVGAQVDHLYELGHRRLAVAGPAQPDLAALGANRARAVTHRAAQLGLPAPDIRAVDHRDGSAAAAVTAWRAVGVTGVVCYNDDIAAAVVGAALDTGSAVPRDLSVIGHDNSPLAELFRPAITSVDFDIAGLATYLARLALHKADGRDLPDGTPGITPILTRRDTTGPAPS
ncbi:LacI family DNA-binding transcriptional regulator [Nocardia sp. NPDC020380]|uniref:LacI family DNA-binding transcriptional regulator n=1 Tax=Nocardia sp. NPDC020380 TaxID=3364309 RepID=UPI0037B44A45